jgi:hypothetical protein
MITNATWNRRSGTGMVTMVYRSLFDSGPDIQESRQGGHLSPTQLEAQATLALASLPLVREHPGGDFQASLYTPES